MRRDNGERRSLLTVRVVDPSLKINGANAVHDHDRILIYTGYLLHEGIL